MNQEILNKIKSIKLCLMAHPDNTLHSEFADRITDCEQIEAMLSNQCSVCKSKDGVKYLPITNCVLCSKCEKELSNSFNEVMNVDRTDNPEL